MQCAVHEPSHCSSRLSIDEKYEPSRRTLERCTEDAPRFRTTILAALHTTVHVNDGLTTDFLHSL